MPFSTVRDLQMYYELKGSGARLLYINGTGGDLRKSPTIFDSPLAREFEILAFDQRGLGQTSRPDTPYTMADYAQDAAALLDHVGWDTCHVLGFSFGGMVAQEFALRHPDRVRSLILASTSSGGAGGTSYPMHQLQGLSTVDYAKQLLQLYDNRLDAAWQAAHAEAFQTMLDFTLEQMRVGADEAHREVGARRQLQARIGHDTFLRLPTLGMPVLICAGVYDDVAPPVNSEAMQKQIPQAELQIFKGGHYFFQQDAKAFAHMATFLRS